MISEVDARNICWIFLLPHPDDEFYAQDLLRHGAAAGEEIQVYFLTDGGDTSGRRSRESLRALQNLGVGPDRISFLGSKYQIADGQLMNSLDRFEEIAERISDLCSRGRRVRVVAPAWEGGHQDHDAAHILAQSLCRRFKIIEEAIQFYLYSGFQTRGRFFTIANPEVHGGENRAQKLSASELFKSLMLVRFYPSQWKTWLGLWPLTVLRLLIHRRFSNNRLLLSQVKFRPHDGLLLYERYQRTSFDKLMACTEEFRRREGMS